MDRPDNKIPAMDHHSHLRPQDPSGSIAHRDYSSRDYPMTTKMSEFNDSDLDDDESDDDNESEVLKSLNFFEPTLDKTSDHTTNNGGHQKKSGGRLDAIVEQALARAKGSSSVPVGPPSMALQEKSLHDKRMEQLTYIEQLARHNAGNRAQAHGISDSDDSDSRGSMSDSDISPEKGSQERALLEQLGMSSSPPRLAERPPQQQQHGFSIQDLMSRSGTQSKEVTPRDWKRSNVIRDHVRKPEVMADAELQKIVRGSKSTESIAAEQGLCTALPVVPIPVQYDSMEVKCLQKTENPHYTEGTTPVPEQSGDMHRLLSDDEGIKSEKASEEEDVDDDEDDDDSLDEEDEISSEDNDYSSSASSSSSEDEDDEEEEVKEEENSVPCDLPMPILTLESELDLGESLDGEKPAKDMSSAAKGDNEDWPLDCLAEERPPSDGFSTADSDAEKAADRDDEESEPKSKKRRKKTEGKPKKKRKRREQGDGGAPKKKRKRKKKSGEEEDEDDDEHDLNKKRKNVFERRNIRKIMEDGNLETETIDAQREEAERKARLLEKLHQQAQELRRQRDIERQESVAEAEEVARKAMDELKNMQLKSLLEADDDSPSSPDKLPPLKASQVSKPAAEDIVEISSSDDDNEIVLMQPDEPSDEEEEDPGSSGSHTNDAMNQPDVQGRVLVNMAHPTEEPDIFLAAQLARAVKPHQIGGIRFLYDNLVESQDRFSNSNGFGCILAHSMGLGKTLQLISFMDVFLRNTDAKTVLCIVPVNTLQNWVSEFNMWLPTAQDLREKFSADVAPDIQTREFALHIVNDNLKSNTARAGVVSNWRRHGGVLLMGYEMYRLLTSKKVLIKPGRKSKKAKQAAAAALASKAPVVIDLEEEDQNKEILRQLHEALMRPGPDLVVCDEGHRIKNSHASISQALKNIRTKRRVVLTGYPLQNNLLEYWCMVDFVRPNYLGSKTEFCNMFERPIMNGQCVDSTSQDARLMRFRAHVLHSLLEGFVQRRGHAVLQLALPSKEEYVLLVRMSPIQRALYSKFMVSMTETGLQNWASNNPLKAFSVCCKIWNHPDVLHRIVEQRKVDDNDLDLEGPMEGEEGKGKKGRGKGAAKLRRAAQSEASSPLPSETSRPPSSIPDTDTPTPSLMNDKKDQVITFEWAEELLRGYQEGLLEHGGKLVLLMDLIQQTIVNSDKLLIFSQSLFTLNLIEEFLGREYIPGTQERWFKNRSYFRLDGSTSGLDREKLINQFNAEDNNHVHLFLLSTRAGCLGINLIGANRVVIFDASWNPCHDCQAVCRVYRYGQCKPCYVYRLVTDNTLEKKIYDRQINKQGMSDRVVDELNPQHMIRKQADALLEYEDKDMPIVDAECAEMTNDAVLGNVLRRHHGWLTKNPFTHESLLIDRKDQKLTKSEKRLAKQGYEMEKKMNVSYSRPSYAAFYPKSAGGNIRYPTAGGRPVASVRPMMSTPIPLRPQGQGTVIQTLQGGTRLQNSSLKPGVSVQQVRTTADITIPGTGSGPNAIPQKIPAGESVLVIKTPKGVYIRTNQGKIFAVRTAMKASVAASTSGASVSGSKPTAESKIIPETDNEKEDLSDSPLAATTGSTVTVVTTTASTSAGKANPKQNITITKPQTSLLRPSVSLPSSVVTKEADGKVVQSDPAKKTFPVIIKSSQLLKGNQAPCPLPKITPSKEKEEEQEEKRKKEEEEEKRREEEEQERKEKKAKKPEKKKKPEKRLVDSPQMKQPLPQPSLTTSMPQPVSQANTAGQQLQQPPPVLQPTPAAMPAAAAPQVNTNPPLPTPQAFHPPIPPQTQNPLSSTQSHVPPPYSNYPWGMPPTPSMWGATSSEAPPTIPSQQSHYSSPWDSAPIEPPRLMEDPKPSFAAQQQSQMMGSMTSLLNSSGHPPAPPPPFQDPFSYSQGAGNFPSHMGGYSNPAYSSPYYPAGYQNSYMQPTQQQAAFGAPPPPPPPHAMPDAAGFGSTIIPNYNYNNPMASHYPMPGSGYPGYMGMMPPYDMGGSGGNPPMSMGGGRPGAAAADPSQGMV